MPKTNYEVRENDKVYAFWDAPINPITMKAEPEPLKNEEPQHAEHQVNWGVKYTST